MNINRVFVRLFAFVGLLLLAPAMVVCNKLNLLPPHIWWEAPATDIALGFGLMLGFMVFAVMLHIFRLLVHREQN